MRSESLRRLDSLPRPKPMGPTLTHEEVDQQVQDFLRRGGEITLLPNTLGAPPSGDYAPVLDPVSKKVLSMPARQLVDGRYLLTLQKVARMVGVSAPTIHKRRKSGTFPEHVSKVPQVRWDEADVLRWMEENPDQVKTGNCGDHSRL